MRRRCLPRHRISGFRRDSSLQSQSGGRHVMYYTLYATDDGGNEIVVGESFHGDGEAAAAQRYIAKLFGLRLPAAADGPAVADTDPLAADF